MPSRMALNIFYEIPFHPNSFNYIPLGERPAICWCLLSSRSDTMEFLTVLSSPLGEKLWEVQCESPTFTVAWHPKRPLLAFACDDKDGKYDSSREASTVKLFGLLNDS